jgi:hypothetical protein
VNIKEKFLTGFVYVHYVTKSTTILLTNLNIMSINIPIENILPGIRASRGIFTQLSIAEDLQPTAVNATATLTSASIEQGYITTTSAAAVTMTMPTGTLLGALLGATQGYTMHFIVDNTAGANPVTMAVGTNAVQSDWNNQITTATASVTPATVTPLTITNGVSGIGIYRIVFSSATAYTFSRIG